MKVQMCSNQRSRGVEILGKDCFEIKILDVCINKIYTCYQNFTRYK